MCLLFAILVFIGGTVLRAKEIVAADPPSRIQRVVFIISDDLKASVLGCYGDDVCHTPNIDRLAAEGMVFERAYCQGTWCAPSRQSFMFSRYVGKGKVNLGEHFRNNSWHSARVGKIYHMKVPGDIIAGTDGLDVPSSWDEKYNSPGLEAHTPGDYACLNQNIFTTEMEGRQSTAMPHRAYVTVSYEGNGSDQPDHKSADKAIELLKTHKDKKFFLAVGLIRPHYPMVAPQQFFEPYPHDQITLPKVIENDLDDIPQQGISGSRSAKNGLDKYPENQQRMWSGYYASVTFMDQQVGRILDELDRLELRETTAIVFTSDHGYHLGEHTFWQKSNLHEEVTRVPLIMSVPGYSPGRSKSLVELMDIFPTLCELNQLEIPKSVQGKSLLKILRNPSATVREAVLTVGKNGYGLRTAEWAYMKYKKGSTELYHMTEDPDQFYNLAEQEKFSESKREMQRRLSSQLKQFGLSP